MRLQKLAAIAFTVLCATAASAQNPAARQTTAPDDGFFRPSANPDLTAPRPGEATRPTEALTAEDHVQANSETRSDRAPDPVQVLQWSESQMDRSEQRNERARREAPTPINGAFTGSTNERDR